MGQTFVLRNGTEEFKPLVTATFNNLKKLLGEDPTAFYDLVMLCRDKTYQPFEDLAEKLKDKQLLLPDGRIHGSIRNIVLSATEGEKLSMKLVDPVVR